MVKPTLTDYVALFSTLFDRFWQHHTARPHRGRPVVYQHKALIVFSSSCNNDASFASKPNGEGCHGPTK